MKKIPIYKSLVQSHKQCKRRAWLEASGIVEPEYSMSARGIINQGMEVHRAARSLFEGAVMVPGSMGLEDAAEMTQELIAKGVTSIAEAAFVHGDLGVRLDMLCKTESGWRGVEVKSGGSVKDEYLDDVAIQHKCLSLAGMQVESIWVMHPSTEKERAVGGTGAEVLVEDDVSEYAVARAESAVIWIEECRETLKGEEPKIAPGEQCEKPNQCPFTHYCGKAQKNTDPDRIELLPSKSTKGVKKAVARGLKRISDLSSGELGHPRNVLVHAAVLANRNVIVREFAEFMLRLPYPRYYVDFEAASFAIPRFEGTRAHQAIPFQWSCHWQDTPWTGLNHAEYLDVTGNDPRRGFIESLLKWVGESGPIIVYSSYEKSRLKELALAYPDLAEAIAGVLSRLVDLLLLARRGYYAPKMLGSWSIKKVLPTLPKCDAITAYEDLEDVAEGTAAQAAYMEQIDGSVIGADKERRRQSMLIYCGTDTLALAHFSDYVQARFEEENVVECREVVIDIVGALKDLAEA